MSELRKYRDIMILPADKGKATVVLNVTDYENKVTTMLSDSRTYEKLKKKNTQNYKTKLVFIAILAR